MLDIGFGKCLPCFPLGNDCYHQRRLRCPQSVHFRRGTRLMLKYYVKAHDLLERLRADKDGVVSFEYVIVAACIVAAVAAAFGTGATGAIGTALTNAIAAIVAQLPAAPAA